jgi:PAS domain S-box-containing protein
VHGVLQDITARKQAELALRESEARLRLAMLVGRMGAFDWHLQTNEIHCSEEMTTMLGLSPDQLGRTLAQMQVLVHPDDREGFRSAFQTAVEGKGELEHECRFRLPDSSVRWVLTIGRVLRNRTGRPVHLLGVAMDVTERRQLHEELLQSQKMEGIGRLAGGVAHDFNNLLTAILGYGELAEKEIAPDHPARSHLAQIQQAAGRAADLTQHLLSFARKQRMEPRLIDLNTLLQNLDQMLRLLIGGDIDLIIRSQEELWTIRADPNHIEQMVINLAVNARDAMPQGGRLTVETANVTLGPDEAKTWAEGVPGDFVRLSLSDTGIGMDSAVVRNIFDPFYTTKEMGKGTGLGLAICLGIVKQHSGHIVVRSEPGRGTTFHIHLPRASTEGME